MKKETTIFLLTMLMSLVGAKTFAHDIAVNNDDGVTIYYVWTNGNTELAVSYQGTSWIGVNEYSGEVVIPESVFYEGMTYSVTSVGDYAFAMCNGLTSVTIPSSVTSIGTYAFAMCSGLTSITIPNSVTFINNGAFQNCIGLTSVTFGNGLTFIGQEVFMGCIGLTNITIPNTVTFIGNGAFSDCSGLTTVTIPNTVTEIGDGAFYGCMGLASITIPNSVTKISAYAFSECYALTTVIIGSGVTEIGDGAFSGSVLTDVYCSAETVPSTSLNAFEGSNIESATLHVPDVSLENYSSTAPWSSFGTKIALEKCATPTITIADGEIAFSCETDGVEFVSEITASDAKKYYDGKIVLTNKYIVSVYAAKDGFGNSDVVTEEITIGGNSAGSGDVNGDGVIDVLDYVGVANIILTGSIYGSNNAMTKVSAKKSINK